MAIPAQLISSIKSELKLDLAGDLDDAMLKIKHWIVTSVVALVMASGSSALAFYISVENAVKLASNNERRLNDRSAFIALTKAQMSQMETELQKSNPNFKLVDVVITYE